MKTLAKWLGIFVAVVGLAIGLFFLSMRFHDGPIEVFSGGPFTSGELTAAPVDWTFLTDRDLMEFQTLDPATSRTVWLAVYDQRLFVLSGYMTTTYGGIWKQWPHYLEDDDRVILRLDGKLYEQRLERVMEGPEVAGALAEISRKYGVGGSMSTETVDTGDTWMFEVVDRD